MFDDFNIRNEAAMIQVVEAKKATMPTERVGTPSNDTLSHTDSLNVEQGYLRNKGWIKSLDLLVQEHQQAGANKVLGEAPPEPAPNVPPPVTAEDIASGKVKPTAEDKAYTKSMASIGRNYDEMEEAYQVTIREDLTRGVDPKVAIENVQRAAGIVGVDSQGKERVDGVIGPNTRIHLANIPINKYDEVTFQLEGAYTSGGGYNSETNRYTSYDSIEGGTNTIGFGHKLKNTEVTTNKIYGVDFSNGLSRKEALYIYMKDKQKLTDDLGLSGQPENIQFLAADVAHRVGSISGWNYLAALKEGNLSEAFRHLGNVSYTSGGQVHYYDDRNEKIFKEAGYIPTEEDWEAYYVLQNDDTQ